MRKSSQVTYKKPVFKNAFKVIKLNFTSAPSGRHFRIPLIYLLTFTGLLSFSYRAMAQVDPQSEKGSTEKAFSQRLIEEKNATQMKYTFSAFKPTYILPVTYNSTPSPGSRTDLSKVDYLEVKFQFSFKIDLVDSFWNDKLKWTLAYTNLSFWQLYNKENSRPFRESNHEPDMFLAFYPSGTQASWGESIYRLGIVHQSNGQNAPVSRSWNRIYVQGLFNLGEVMTTLKVWKRFYEDPKPNEFSVDGDDNPNIEEYLGYFELQLVRRFGTHTAALLFRNNGRSKDNHGAIQVDYSLPISGSYRGYFQYFNGYGESLIDYDHPVSRVGVGILVSDWL